jgi:hypothetical protein
MLLESGSQTVFDAIRHHSKLTLRSQASRSALDARPSLALTNSTSYIVHRCDVNSKVRLRSVRSTLVDFLKRKHDVIPLAPITCEVLLRQRSVFPLLGYLSAVPDLDLPQYPFHPVTYQTKSDTARGMNGDPQKLGLAYDPTFVGIRSTMSVIGGVLRYIERHEDFACAMSGSVPKRWLT